jgi:hypothetical protein
MESEILLYAAPAFLMGYLVRGLLSFLYTVGKTGNFVRKVTLQVIELIVVMAQDIEFIKAAKYKTLEDAGVDPNTLIREKNMEVYSHEKWKNMIVKSFISNYPEEFRKHFVPFENWNEMVQHFDSQRASQSRGRGE